MSSSMLRKCPARFVNIFQLTHFRRPRLETDSDSTDCELINLPDEGSPNSTSGHEDGEVREEASAVVLDSLPTDCPDEPPEEGPVAVGFNPAAPLYHLPDTFPGNDESVEEDAGHEDIGDLAREWILLQLGKVCSNEISDAYFSMAWDMCEVFMRCKQALKKKPLLKSMRRKIIADNVPGIKLDYIIRDKARHEAGDNEESLIYLYNQSKFPLKRYPSSKYEVLNQITRVDVSTNLILGI